MRGRSSPAFVVGSVIAMAVAAALLWATPAAAPWSAQDDAGTGGDAGDTFGTATDIGIPVQFEGKLAPSQGDPDDFYKFTLEEGDQLVVDLLNVDREAVGPITLIDPEGRPMDTGVNAGGQVFFVPGSATATTALSADNGQLSIAHAPTDGDYRLHLHAEGSGAVPYEICIRPCEQTQQAPIGLSDPLRDTDIDVLIVPPAHPDLTDPNGPTQAEYVATARQAVEDWEPAIDQFTDDHPDYDYLDQLSINVDVLGEPQASADGYDAVIGYTPSGPAFRGLAYTNCPAFWIPEDVLHQAAASTGTDTCPRPILLSTFASSPRAGQVAPDSPTLEDLRVVTFHESAHAFGLIHTQTWTADYGPDLMNSPAPFFYGEGEAAGNPPSPVMPSCPSSLDIYGLAVLYEWVDEGSFSPPSQAHVDLPSGMAYELYCP